MAVLDFLCGNGRIGLAVMALTLIKVQQILSYIGPMLAAVLLFRLWAEGLIERYRFFARLKDVS